MDRCSPSYILHLLGKKWTYKILKQIPRCKHFNEIEKLLPGITHHILSEELKYLEKEKLIHKGEDCYRLTTPGKELLDAIEPLLEWTYKHKGFSKCPRELECRHCARYKEYLQ